MQLEWPRADLIASLAVSQEDTDHLWEQMWDVPREEKQLGQGTAKGASLAGLLPA